MGKLSNGILGQVSNKVGNVVGSSWKGINTVRIYKDKIANPKTAKQVAARTNMSNAVIVAQQITSSFIQPLWNRFAKGMSGYNAWVSANMGVAFIDSAIDESSFIMSTGKMLKPVVTGALHSNHNLTISFGTVAGDAYALATDEVYICVINRQGVVGYVGKTNSTRVDVEGHDEIVALSADFDVSTAYCYVAFRRADGTIVSDSKGVEVEG